MTARGWNRTTIDKLIANLYRTKAVRDTRHLHGGGKADDPATAYINQKGHYVIRNDRTGENCPGLRPPRSRLDCAMGLKSVAERRIQRAFADVGIERGSEFYVAGSAAGRYVDSCLCEYFAIAGVEVLRLKEGKMKADLSQIADFSTMLSSDKNWNLVIQETAAETQRYLNQIPSDQDVWLSFTLISEQEYASGHFDELRRSNPG